MIGIVLQLRQTLEQARAVRADEKRWQNSSVRIAQMLEDGRPTANAIHVGGLQIEAELAILVNDGSTVAFAAEHVGAGDEARGRRWSR